MRVLTYPLRVLGFIEEINIKKWVLHGENITLYNSAYHESNYNLITFDYITIQLILPLLPPELRLSLLFYNYSLTKKTKLDRIYNSCIRGDVKALSREIQEEKCVFPSFFKVLYIIQTNRVSMLNSLFKIGAKAKNHASVVEEVVSHLLMGTFSSSLQELTKSSSKIFAEKLDFKTQLLKVADFN